MSIGQGYLTVSPIWINSYMSAIANGGRIMKPYLAQKIVNSKNEIIFEAEPEIIEQFNFDESSIDIVRQGMRQTITSGTASSLNSLSKPIAGKTGTAQITGDKLNSLFTSYGPYNNPEIAITIILEDIGENQSLAVRVANDFFSWYFSATQK